VVKDDGNRSEFVMPKLMQSKSFANNIVLFLMADIVLDVIWENQVDKYEPLPTIMLVSWSRSGVGKDPRTLKLTTKCM
jgi:hypothetical protein